MSFTGKRLLQAAPSGGLIGEITLNSSNSPVTGQWTVPDGVYSISVLTIGAGLDGASGTNGTASTPGQGGQGGATGIVHYKNDIPVVPGQLIPYLIGPPGTNPANRTSLFETTSSIPTPIQRGYTQIVVPGVTAGENGGPGSSVTFESGYGGRATTGISATTPSTTTVSLTGTINPGTTTPGGNGANGRASISDYGAGGGGGGGGARLDGAQGGAGGSGRRGCIRIVWPGDSRQFPDNV